MPSVRPTVCRPQATSATRRVAAIQPGSWRPASSEAMAKANGIAKELNPASRNGGGGGAAGRPAAGGAPGGPPLRAEAPAATPASASAASRHAVPRLARIMARLGAGRGGREARGALGEQAAGVEHAVRPRPALDHD